MLGEEHHFYLKPYTCNKSSKWKHWVFLGCSSIAMWNHYLGKKTQIHLSGCPSFRTCSIHDRYKRDQLINPKDGKIEERSTRGGGYELPKAKYYVPSKLLEITTHFKSIVNFASSFKNLKLMPYPSARKKTHFSLNYECYP